MADTTKSGQDNLDMRILDPSKFKIIDDNQVVLIDPELVTALRAANEGESGAHGVSGVTGQIGVTATFGIK